MKKFGDTFSFDEVVEKALLTWYPKDHPLYFNPHHPLGKLLGEWGELLDDYMKSLYKPGYVFEPENELGDIWYYVRILCYQENYEPKNRVCYSIALDRIIVQCMWVLSELFLGCSKCSTRLVLDDIYSAICTIAKRHNLTLDDLTRSNWEKLKPGSERGEQWAKARAAKPEPMPKQGQVDIWPLVVDDIKSRVETGQRKYGTVLQSYNGRYAIMDAYQEAIDLVMYLRQVIEEDG